MIFQHTWQQVLDESKTQTRRPFQHEHFDGEWGPSGVLVNAGMQNSAMIDEGELKRITVVYPANSDDGRLCDDNFKCKRAKWEVGKTYPVQPGRGQKLVGRIEILRIWREDVRTISEVNAKAEGYGSIDDFLATWAWMHDKSSHLRIEDRIPGGFWLYRHMGKQRGVDYGKLAEALKIRPNFRYDGWAIEFKRVEP